MARPKKVYQTPVIEEIDTEDIEEVVKVVEKPVETVKIKSTPLLIPRDNSVIARRMPTMEVKHVVSNLIANRSYKIRKTVKSAIYGEFYVLENGLYVAKVGNFIVKE